MLNKKSFRGICAIVIICIASIISAITMFEYNDRASLIVVANIYLAYTAYILVFREIYLENIAIKIILTIGGFRYLVMPSFLYLYDIGFIKRSNFIPYDYNDIRVIVVLICEIIGIAFAIGFFGEKQKKAKDIVKSKLIGNKKIYILLALVYIITIIISNDMRSYYSFFTMTSYEVENNINGIIYFVFNHMFMIGKVGLIGIIIEKYNSDKIKKRNLMIVIISIVTLSSIYRGSNRGFLLINYLTGVFLLVNIYFQHKKKILIIMICPLLIMILSITVVRNLGYEQNTKVYTETIDREYFGELGQMYLAGPDNILIAIESIENKSLVERGKMILGNLLFTIPGVSENVRENSGVYHFNGKFYNHYYFQDQIISLSGEGYIMGGYLGSIFIVFLISSFAIKFYYKACKTSLIEEKYIYIFCSVWFALGCIYNSMILVQSIVHHSLGIILVLVYFKVGKRRGINEKSSISN